MPLRGLNPGFKACSLRIVIADSASPERTPVVLPVQIYRYTEANRGWTELMRTGPAEFGKWFLGEWKKIHNIPPEKPASIEGSLVDSWGKVVPVPREEDCFRILRIAYIAPWERER